MTPAAEKGLSVLRDYSTFEWYIIPILLIVIHIYASEIGKKNWKVVYAGLGLFGMDFFNEIWNGLVFHFSQHAPVWGAPGKTCYLILIGWNIEILFMFLVMGVAAAKLLPEDKSLKVFGLPNRLVFALANTTACVFVECILNAIGALTWDYPWWSIKMPVFVFLFGYLPFFLVCFWIHDMKTDKQRAITVGSILGFDIMCVIIFGGVLGWL